MNKLKVLKIFTLVMVAAMLLAIPLSAGAASRIVIKADSSVKAGDTFTASVEFKSSDIGRVEGQLTYDPSVLSYISGGTSSGDSGYIELKDAGTGEAIEFNIEFKALASGDTKLNISTSGVYNLDEEFIDAPSASKKILVKGDEIETSETSPTETDAVVDNAEEIDNQSSGLPIIPIIIGLLAILVIILIIITIIKKSNKKGKHSKFK